MKPEIIIKANENGIEFKGNGSGSEVAALCTTIIETICKMFQQQTSSENEAKAVIYAVIENGLKGADVDIDDFYSTYKELVNIKEKMEKEEKKEEKKEKEDLPEEILDKLKGLVDKFLK